MNKSQSNPSAPGEAMLGNKLRPAVLPADGIRRPGCKWCETSDDLDQADRQQLDELGRADSMLPAAYLSVSYAVLFSLITGESLVTVGLPVCSETGLRPVAVGVQTDFDLTLDQLIRKTYGQLCRLVQAQEHPNPQLCRFVAAMPIGTPCLVSSVQAIHRTTSWLSGWETEMEDMELSVRLTERGRLIQRWRAGLFHPPWARQMGRYALRILTLALQTPGARLCDIELAPPAAVTSEHIGDPTPERVIEQFRSICRASPDRPCLREGTRCFSYGRLERRVTLLARRLKAVGVQPGRPVAVLADRSIETIVAMLAVFAAGAVYLPIDKALPKGRIHAILNDSHPAAALCASEERPLLPAGLPALPLEWKEASRPDPEAFIKYDATGYDDADPAHSAAYLIYTSGSTGHPKGVLLPWEGIARLGDCFRTKLQIGRQDVVGQFASISFDASVWEMLMALLTGAQLVLLSEEARTDPRRLVHEISQYGITVLTLPPHVASLLNPSDLPSLRMMITAGASPSAKLVERWSQQTDYVNAYGPTETSICAALWIVPKGSFVGEGVSIGRPISDYSVRILGPDGRARPPFLPGEMVIEGEGVALEYRNEAGLTRQKIHPGKKGKRQFYTGDIGRVAEGGRLEFIGRRDAQLKLRGYRIEPEEIRQTLLSLDLAGDAAVIAQRDGSGDERLCAYLMEPRTTDKATLDRLLGEFLPDYMLPDRYQQVKAIPLTLSGKVDASARPNPYHLRAGRDAAHDVGGGRVHSDKDRRKRLTGPSSPDKFDDHQYANTDTSFSSHKNRQFAYGNGKAAVNDRVFPPISSQSGVDLTPCVEGDPPCSAAKMYSASGSQVKNSTDDAYINVQQKQSTAQTRGISCRDGAPIFPAAKDLSDVDAIQRHLKDLWQEVLEVDIVTPEDDFFRLGGHSLKAIRLRGLMEEAFGVRLDIREIYASPSLRGMTERIARSIQNKAFAQSKE